SWLRTASRCSGALGSPGSTTNTCTYVGSPPTRFCSATRPGIASGSVSCRVSKRSGRTMSDTMDLDTFRREAREWIIENLERKPADSHAIGSEDKTPEEIAASRVLQRKLFDAGFAGISYPKEYGGRGLTAAHERVWREETIGYVVPDFGGAGH